MTQSDSTTVRDVVSLQRGTTYKSPLLGRPGPVLLGLATIERDGGFRDDSLVTYGGDSPDKLLLRPGDLYISLKDVTQTGDLLGAVARLPKSVACGRLTQDTAKLIIKRHAVSPSYLYWLLRTPAYRRYCRERGIGTTNLALSREDFLRYPVPPETPAREKLVALLDAIESKVDLNYKMNQTLEALAQALFKSWFVDFDPVIAKHEGRAPFGMEVETAALFPAHFQDSELGPIPEGWSTAVLEQVARNVRDKAHRDSLDPTTPYVGLEHMDSRRLTLTRWGSLGSVVSDKFVFRPEQLLFSKLRPYFHKVCVAPFDGVCSTDILVCESQVTEHRSFLYLQMFDDSLVDYADAASHGTRMPRTDWKTISQFKIVKAPDRVLQRFHGIVAPLLRTARAGQQENYTLAALRELLLTKLHAGSIQLKAAERAMADVV